MSAEPTQICDRAALVRNRKRWRPGADFLHREARADIEDRLAMVNRAFTAPAIVTGHPAVWVDLLQGAQLVEDTDTLALEVGAHDLVIHAMCLHWANDPVGQIIQCRRALKPDGLFLAVLPGGQTLNELRSALSQAEAETRGGLSPRILPMADIRDLGALLQRAGLALPVADTNDLLAEYDGLRALAHDLRYMGEANALMSRDKSPTTRTLFDRAEAIYGQHFPGQEKALRATFQLITLTGWAPADSQPQPLRPGSAKKRLADTLGTRETPLPD